MEIKKPEYEIKHPFLNKVSVRNGKFKDYLELEKYHYFHDLDEECYEAYGGKIHSLYFENQLIGIILYIFPYQLEYAEQEDEFALINSLIACSYRVIIHPSFRGIGLTKYFFEESYKLLGMKFVYACAAMAVYNPFYQKAGFHEVSDIDYTQEEEYKLIQTYLDGNSSIKKEVLLEHTVTLLGKVMYRWYSQYCTVIEKKEIFSVESFQEMYSGVYDVDDIEMLVQELKYIRMKHFVYTR